MKTIIKNNLSRLLGTMIVIMLGCLLAHAQEGSAPSWWYDRGVIDPLADTNDFGMLNQGQLKWMATNAYDEFVYHIPYAVTPALSNRIAGFSSLNNYLPVNLGQLKYTASPFYDILITEGITSTYPWAYAPATNDFAPANIGQMKQLFCFELDDVLSSISGNIIYNGSQSGQIIVIAVPAETPWQYENSVVIAGPGQYTIPNLFRNQQYWIKAHFLRADHPANYDDEAWGTSPLNPIYLDQNVTGIDVTLYDAGDRDSDGLDDWMEIIEGLDPEDEDPDDDGLNDFEEWDTYATDPFDPDTDDDGLLDGEEVSRGTDPRNEDSDGDSIIDGLEVQYGFNPLDNTDATEDADGDYYPNNYECINGSDPLDASSIPTPTCYVDPIAGDGGDGTSSSPLNSIQAAFGQYSGEYNIIALVDGLYTGAVNRDLSFPANTMLKSLNGPDNCIIDCRYQKRAFEFRDIDGDSTFLWGVTIRNGYAPEGGGIFCEYADPTIFECILEYNYASGQSGGGIYFDHSSPVINKCIIRKNYSRVFGGGICSGSGCSAKILSTIISENSSDEGGGGITDWDSSSEIKHCTIISNHSDYAGGVEACSSYEQHICYSVIWGNTPDPFEGNVVTHDCHVQGQNIDLPLLSIDGHLKSLSPCIDIIHSYGANPGDIDRDQPWDKPNVGSEIGDVGADEFVDTDADDLPDAWEYKYFSSLANIGSDDNDLDGVNNTAEYEMSCNPADDDTDQDGVSDYDEMTTYLTSPTNPDTDSDRMPDGWEIQYGFNPLVSGDNGEDHDQDGYPNVYECYHRSIPNDPLSIPQPTVFVDGSVASSGNGTILSPFKTISEAVANRLCYDIIEIADGIYNEDKLLLVDDRPVILKSLSGARKCTINVNTNGTAIEFRSSTFGPFGLCGVTVRNEEGCGIGLSANNFISDCRIINCIDGIEVSCIEEINCDVYLTAIRNSIIANNLGIGIQIVNEGINNLIQNCTILNNKNGGIDLGNSSLTIINSIIWSNETQISYSDNEPVVTYSLIQGGWTGVGNLDANPITTKDGYLMSGSPCFDLLETSTVYGNDIDDEVRWDIPSVGGSGTVIADIGADEFIDSDGDSLADAWELLYFMNLSHDGTADSDTGGSDGLSDAEEYLHGCDPTNMDSDNDSIGDGQEVNVYGSDPMRVDTDGDGLDDYSEIFIYYSDPNVVDSDGDDLGDGDEVNLYNSDPMDTDTDDDQILDGTEVLVYGTDPSLSDTDGDDLSDYQEIEEFNTNPLELTFEDNDSMPDEWEYVHFGDLEQNDTTDFDEDRVTDQNEYLNNTDPTNWPDTDADGVVDDWEIHYFSSLNITDGTQDFDGDSYTDLEEFRDCTNPTDNQSYFTDNHPYHGGNGISDAWEIRFYGSVISEPYNDYDNDHLVNYLEYFNISNPKSPTVLDSDSDGMSDDWESYYFGTATAGDPSVDTDGDTYNNLLEWQAGSDPTNGLTYNVNDEDSLPDEWEWHAFGHFSQNDTTDFDGDHLNDYDEYTTGTDPTNNADSDSDEMSDDWETYYFGSPPAGDPLADPDRDCLTSAEEYIRRTSPVDMDTDGDGLVDGSDGCVQNNAYAEGYDTDDDGYVDGEDDFGTDPLLYSTDGDGASDGKEVFIGSDPFCTYDIVLANIVAEDAFFDPTINNVDINFSVNWDCDVTVKIKPVIHSVGNGGDVSISISTSVVREVWTSCVSGACSVSWDGKNDAGQYMTNNVFVYAVSATSSYGLISEIYDPVYYSGPVTVSDASVSTDNHLWANDLCEVSYELSEPAFVSIGTETYPTVAAWGEPRDCGANVDYFSGRNVTNRSILYTNGLNVCIKAKILPDNHIVIKEPTVVDNIAPDVYLINPKYSDVSNIKYSLSEDATITMRIRGPNGDVITLLDNEYVSSGLNEIEWDAVNWKGELVSTEGDYELSVYHQSILSGNAITNSANIRVLSPGM